MTGLGKAVSDAVLWKVAEVRDGDCVLNMVGTTVSGAELVGKAEPVVLELGKPCVGPTVTITPVVTWLWLGTTVMVVLGVSNELVDPLALPVLVRDWLGKAVMDGLVVTVPVMVLVDVLLLAGTLDPLTPVGDIVGLLVPVLVGVVVGVLEELPMFVGTQ